MEAFLETLFGEAVSEDRRVCIFTLPNRRARHFSSLKAAAIHAAKAARTSDVYFEVGLAGTNFGRRNAAADGRASTSPASASRASPSSQSVWGMKP